MLLKCCYTGVQVFEIGSSLTFGSWENQWKVSLRRRLDAAKASIYVYYKREKER